MLILLIGSIHFWSIPGISIAILRENKCTHCRTTDNAYTRIYLTNNGSNEHEYILDYNIQSLSEGPINCDLIEGDYTISLLLSLEQHFYAYVCVELYSSLFFLQQLIGQESEDWKRTSIGVTEWTTSGRTDLRKANILITRQEVCSIMSISNHYTRPMRAVRCRRKLATNCMFMDAGLLF